MARFGSWKLLLVAAAAAAALVVVPSAGATAVANGDFETGDLSGWTQQTVGDTEWDTFGSFAGITAPHGSYGVGVFQGDPSAAVLYQTLHLGSGYKKLRMYVFYNNAAGVFCTPPTLDPGFTKRTAFTERSSGPKEGPPFCNQQFRIDIMRSDADPWSVASGDVIKNLFWTLGGSPFRSPKKMTFSLKGLSGDVLLRLAEVDNEYYFFAGVDQVQLLG